MQRPASTRPPWHMARHKRAPRRGHKTHEKMRERLLRVMRILPTVMGAAATTGGRLSMRVSPPIQAAFSNNNTATLEDMQETTSKQPHYAKQGKDPSSAKESTFEMHRSARDFFELRKIFGLPAASSSDDDGPPYYQGAFVANLTTAPNNKDQGKYIEFAALGIFMSGLSSFLLVNNYVGPWPAALLKAIPVKFYGLAHALSAMMFGGGIVLTTLIEWLATDSKDKSVLNFYFDKVPALDSLVVLPALTVLILSGVGLSVDHYGSLGQAPFHVVGAIATLLAFAVWCAVTDLTTQGAAKEAIQDWTRRRNDSESIDVPGILQFRKFSNVVSCVFVTAIYGIMVLKPKFSPPIV